MSSLFSPISLGSLALKNRIAVAPMCQYSAQDGQATDWHTIHLGQMSQSGAGILFIEATAVEAIGRISPQDLGLWSNDTEAALARVLKAVRRYSAMPIAIQLAHAGRKASTQVPWHGGKHIHPADPAGWQTVAPSALAFGPNDSAPQSLDAIGLARVRNAFAAAARRAYALGLDAIEVHAAHGYLLHQFLSPLSNARDDAYGGSLENRMRFPLEVFEAVREAVPESMPVGLRLSATDWVEGGWDIEQSVVFCKELAKRGVAFLDASSGGASPLQKIPLGAGYQVPFAQRIKAETGVPTLAVGLITEPQQAEDVVAGGQADMVSLARAMLFNPHWPWRAAAELGAQVDAPPQYWRAQPHGVKNLFAPTV